MLELRDGNRVITISELWGPFPCEYKEKDCDGNSFAFILAKEEYKKIEKKFGSEMIRLILDNKLGKVICSSCLEKMIGRVGVSS